MKKQINLLKTYYQWFNIKILKAILKTISKLQKPIVRAGIKAVTWFIAKIVMIVICKQI